jgi:hypothetical protein
MGVIPSEFPNDEVKKVVLHITSSGKASAQVGNRIAYWNLWRDLEHVAC